MIINPINKRGRAIAHLKEQSCQCENTVRYPLHQREDIFTVMEWLKPIRDQIRMGDSYISEPYVRVKSNPNAIYGIPMQLLWVPFARVMKGDKEEVFAKVDDFSTIPGPFSKEFLKYLSEHTTKLTLYNKSIKQPATEANVNRIAEYAFYRANRVGDAKDITELDEHAMNTLTETETRSNDMIAPQFAFFSEEEVFSRFAIRDGRPVGYLTPFFRMLIDCLFVNRYEQGKEIHSKGAAGDAYKDSFMGFDMVRISSPFIKRVRGTEATTEDGIKYLKDILYKKNTNSTVRREALVHVSNGLLRFGTPDNSITTGNIVEEYRKWKTEFLAWIGKLPGVTAEEVTAITGLITFNGNKPACYQIEDSFIYEMTKVDNKWTADCKDIIRYNPKIVNFVANSLKVPFNPMSIEGVNVVNGNIYFPVHLSTSVGIQYNSDFYNHDIGIFDGTGSSFDILGSASIREFNMGYGLPGISALMICREGDFRGPAVASKNPSYYEVLWSGTTSRSSIVKRLFSDLPSTGPGEYSDILYRTGQIVEGGEIGSTVPVDPENGSMPAPEGEPGEVSGDNETSSPQTPQPGAPQGSIAKHIHHYHRGIIDLMGDTPDDAGTE